MQSTELSRNDPLSLIDRLLLGALAGIGGTIAMTAAMRRLARVLPPDERYPMPPRELIEETLPVQGHRALSETGHQSLTVAAHFGYGALTGALLALQPKQPGPALGASYGAVVWALSYLGWIPAARILKPATRHPAARNATMIAVHLLWGSVTVATLNELQRGRQELFGKGPSRDAPERFRARPPMAGDRARRFRSTAKDQRAHST